MVAHSRGVDAATGRERALRRPGSDSARADLSTGRDRWQAHDWCDLERGPRKHYGRPNWRNARVIVESPTSTLYYVSLPCKRFEQLFMDSRLRKRARSTNPAQLSPLSHSDRTSTPACANTGG